MAKKNISNRPVVLTIAGHDPTGGAGVQADIETIAHANCRAVSLISILTAQNTMRFGQVQGQSAEIFADQFELLVEDIAIDICKIGLVTGVDLIKTISSMLERLNIPLVLDPVLYSGTNVTLVNERNCRALIQQLVPLAQVITPNTLEAKTLTGSDNLDDAAEKLINYGAQSVLITGTHEKTSKVSNYLYTSDGQKHQYDWPRLEHEYHGSGCTLSTRIAANIAKGYQTKIAVKEAQTYTWNCLNQGVKIGHAQYHPTRFIS